MRTIHRARWASLALALTIALPTQLAAADHKTGGTKTRDKTVEKDKRSISECTSFDQQDRDSEDGVDLSVNNGCSIPVTCQMSWRVTCAPESKKRRSRKSESHDFALDASNGITLTASAARCGDDSWSVDDISWSCEPSDE